MTQTFPSLSTWIPCGVTNRSAPKFASTSPVFRSNLKIGSTGLVSQFTLPPDAVPAAHRSYAQMCPSIGSMSIPAVVPHSLPSGRSPQFVVTVGFGFGRPSPVTGLPIVAGLPDGAHPASRAVAQVRNADAWSLDDDIWPPW